MDTNVKAVVNALVNNDYESMKSIFAKNDINDDVYGLMLLESSNDDKLKSVFAIEAISAVNNIIRKLNNVTIQDIDLSEFYPNIIEGKEYPCSIMDGLKATREKYLDSIRTKLGIPASYTLSPNEATFIRYLEKHNVPDCPIKFPFAFVNVEYCHEPFKFVETTARGYGNNRYSKFTFSDKNVLVHYAKVNLVYPAEYTKDEELNRKEMLRIIGNKANKTLIMADEMSKKLEIERLYNKITELYKNVDEIEKLIKQRQNESEELDKSISEKTNSLNELISQVSVLDAYLAELNEKKAALESIEKLEVDINQVDKLTNELTSKNTKYERLLKISEKVDYYEQNAKELKIMRRCYNNMRDIACRLRNGEDSLARRISDFNAEYTRKNKAMEEELRIKTEQFDQEMKARESAIEKREHDYADFKARQELENNKWKDGIRQQYQKEIDAYPLLIERVESLKTENASLASEKKKLEEKVIKLENALDVLKGTWTH